MIEDLNAVEAAAAILGRGVISDNEDDCLIAHAYSGKYNPLGHSMTHLEAHKSQENYRRVLRELRKEAEHCGHKASAIDCIRAIDWFYYKPSVCKKPQNDRVNVCIDLLQFAWEHLDKQLWKRMGY